MTSTLHMMRFSLAALALLPFPVWSQTPERKPLPTSELRTLAAAYQIVLDSYVAPLEGTELIRATIQGMLREIDPDGGEYWSEQELQEFRNGPPAGTGSLGVELRKKNGALIISPVSTGPAFAAGLRFGDHLRTIDGVAVASNTIHRALRLIDGPVGTTVVVGVYRPSQDKTLDITVTRTLVQAPQSSLSDLSPDARILKLPTLSPSQLRSAFNLLLTSWTKSRFSTLILDLRGNQGGTVESAIALSAAFLPKDSVVASMVGRGPNNNRTFRATSADYSREISDDPQQLLPAELRSLPLALLVDGETASGAEIVVAALKDNGRATVIGQPTFGRGSIQTVTPITGSGAIKYTSGHWISPA